jgi:hypothetical protein
MLSDGQDEANMALFAAMQMSRKIVLKFMA